MPLVGPHGSQRLLVLDCDNAGRAIADHTADAAFASSNPAVCTVDADGVVRAASDGTATITATINNRIAIAAVTITHTKEPFAWGFRQHIEPVLTRAGCNSGACHGALAGKGGFKLSLRGYNPAADHFVITRQANARRVNRTTPERKSGSPEADADPATRRRPAIRDRLARVPPTSRMDRRRRDRADVAGRDRCNGWSCSRPPPCSSHKDKLHVLVRAWYADGHAEDVTPWAKFSSTRGTGRRGE